AGLLLLRPHLLVLPAPHGLRDEVVRVVEVAVLHVLQIVPNGFLRGEGDGGCAGEAAEHDADRHRCEPAAAPRHAARVPRPRRARKSVTNLHRRHTFSPRLAYAPARTL